MAYDGLIKVFSEQIDMLKRQVDIIRNRDVRYFRSEGGGPNFDMTEEMLERNLASIKNYEELIAELRKKDLR